MYNSFRNFEFWQIFTCFHLNCFWHFKSSQVKSLIINDVNLISQNILDRLLSNLEHTLALIVLHVWLTFKAHGSKVRVTASKKVMIWVIFWYAWLQIWGYLLPKSAEHSSLKYVFADPKTLFQMASKTGITAAQQVELTHWGREKMAAILQTTKSNIFFWMKIFTLRLKFHWSMSWRLYYIIQPWFR